MWNIVAAILLATSAPAGSFTVDAAASSIRYGTARARGGFDVSLDAHHVERPSLLFVKIEDDGHLDFDLVLRGTR